MRPRIVGWNDGRTVRADGSGRPFVDYGCGAVVGADGGRLIVRQLSGPDVSVLASRVVDAMHECETCYLVGECGAWGNAPERAGQEVGLGPGVDHVGPEVGPAARDDSQLALDL